MLKKLASHTHSDPWIKPTRWPYQGPPLTWSKEGSWDLEISRKIYPNHVMTQHGQVTTWRPQFTLWQAPLERLGHFLKSKCSHRVRVPFACPPTPNISYFQEFRRTLNDNLNWGKEKEMMYVYMYVCVCVYVCVYVCVRARLNLECINVFMI
jgi:hypothetical protein